MPACRTQNLVKHFTKTQKLLQRFTKPPVTIDGLPAFVSTSHWIIDPHTPWVSIACMCLHACQLVLTIATPIQVRYWDLVIGILLVFTATVTPFEVAYLNPHLDGTYHSPALQLMCCSNRCVVHVPTTFMQSMHSFLDPVKEFALCKVP